ncbi:MAG TPA: dihydroorotase, partial [Granulicella sp.]
MPNTVPVNDSVESLRWMLAPERDSAVHLLAMPAVTRGSMGVELTDFEALVRAGAVGFTDDGKPVLEDAVMRGALMASARLGVMISQHAEDTRLTARTGGSSGVNAGALAFRLGLRGMTIEAESRIVDRDIALLRDIERSEGLRPHLHVQHVSTARALEAIRNAKREGLHITCEAAPHHFTLTEAAIANYDTNAKMNPPLRGTEDRDAVIAGLLDGTIDCIATDHAPHARYEKEVEFDRAPNGITGLETSLGLALRVLVAEHGCDLRRIVTLMSTQPARLLGRPELGTLQVGSSADIVIFAPDSTWTFKASESISRSKNTPFDGSPMQGRIVATIVDGRVLYRASA